MRCIYIYICKWVILNPYIINEIRREKDTVFGRTLVTITDFKVNNYYYWLRSIFLLLFWISSFTFAYWRFSSIMGESFHGKTFSSLLYLFVIFPKFGPEHPPESIMRRTLFSLLFLFFGFSSFSIK